MAMREIVAFDAQANLPQLLDEAERGETIIITRDGRRIARLVSDRAARQVEISAAIAEIRAAGKTAGPITVEELLSARDEDRRF
jgi:prevent-host-death family protein